MTFFNKLFIITFCAALSLGPVSVHAAPNESSKTTPHGYKENFCADGAEGMMERLQRTNKDKFDQIANYKEEIENLEKFDAVIIEVSQIKDRYLDSVANAAKNTTDTETIKKLEDVKSILRHGLILNAISTLTQKKPAENSSFYKIVSNNVTSMLKTDAENAEMKKLYETVNNFKEVSDQLPPPDQAALKEKVQKIISEIPKDISPENLLNMLGSDSPLMVQLLSGKFKRADLELCLSEKSSQSSLDACDQILTNPEDRNKLLQTIGFESSKFSQSLESKDAAIKMAVDNNKSELEKSLSDYAIDKSKASRDAAKSSITDAKSQLSQHSQSLDQINMVIRSNLRAAQSNLDSMVKTPEQIEQDMVIDETKLVGMENFFYDKPDTTKMAALGIDVKTKAGAITAQKYQQDALNGAKRDALIFNRDCDFNKQVNAENEDDKIKKCQGVVEKLIPKIQNLKNSHYAKIAELNAKIQNLASDNEFASTENLKKYIAEKYLCSCVKNKSDLSTTNYESLTMMTSSCTTQFMPITKIEGLKDSTNLIATALYAHEIKMPMDKESCTFGPEQMKTFTDTCNNNSSVSKSFADICKSVNSEYKVKVQNQQIASQQNDKWEKYHEDNYVEYNRNSPNGYSAVKKKSNWRVLGEGVLPILPNALPIWFGNYQMKNNIEMLTDQAMMQKQYMHNVDIYNSSPWMFNYNYFSYGNPFSTDASLGLGTTTSGGFNFGQ